MPKCFDCGCDIHPDHEPRFASGQVFHRTPSHCVSELLAEIDVIRKDAGRLDWIASNTGRDTWLDQFGRRFNRGDVDDLRAAIDVLLTGEPGPGGENE